MSECIIFRVVGPVGSVSPVDRFVRRNPKDLRDLAHACPGGSCNIKCNYSTHYFPGVGSAGPTAVDASHNTSSVPRWDLEYLDHRLSDVWIVSLNGQITNPYFISSIQIFQDRSMLG